VARLPRRPAGSSALLHSVRETAAGIGLLLGAAGVGWASVRWLSGPRAVAGGGLGLGLAVGGWVRMAVARDFRRGGLGERAVGRRLAGLERRGWLVAHDVRKPAGGNVDHLLASPRGRVYAVETKLNRFAAPQLAQARAHAEWAAAYFHAPATPVLCVANGRARPRIYAGVWCLGASRLPGFLLSLDASLEPGARVGARPWRRGLRAARR